MSNDPKPNYLKIEDQLCFAVYSASLGFNAFYRKHLKDLGITYPQYLVMLVLWENDTQTVSEIGDKMFLKSTTLTPLLKRLEGQKLLKRERSTTDEREVKVSLTKEGQKLRKLAEKIPPHLFGAASLPVKEMLGLRDVLKSLRDRLVANYR